jgi:Ni/Co efflux regulator RcnB
MMKNIKRNLVMATAVAASMAATVAISAEVTDATVSVKAMADALHLVMDSDRTVYTQKIVNRLVKKDKVITASEHFEDDKAWHCLHRCFASVPRWR